MHWRKEQFHAANQALFRFAKSYLAPALKQFELSLTSPLPKPVRDDHEGFGDFGWIFMFDDSASGPPIMGFGFARNHASGDTVFMIIRSSRDPTRIWYPIPNDEVEFEPFLDCVEEEIGLSI